MPEDDSKAFRPPGPVALVLVRSPRRGRTAVGVPLLIDSGDDVSCLPQMAVAELLENDDESTRYEVEGFDGKKSLAAVAQLDSELLACLFDAQRVLVTRAYGYLGR